MSELNQVTISGRLTADIEVKKTNSQKSVAEFNIAVDIGYGDSKRVVFPTVKAWNHTAEFVATYAGKGDWVAVTGRYDEETWEDKGTGKKRKKSLIVAHDLIIKNKNGAEGKSEPQEGTCEQTVPQGFAAIDEDIPF